MTVCQKASTTELLALYNRSENPGGGRASSNVFGIICFSWLRNLGGPLPIIHFKN
jgi:hypothetical protein